MKCEIPVAKINVRARNAQLAVGVDPERCISLEELPGSGRTPLGVYGAGLAELRYRMPQSHDLVSDYGSTWREHDYKLHVGRVGALHPRIAALVQLGALTCTEKLARGDRQTAENIAIRLDFVLANQPFVWKEGLRFLIANSGILANQIRSQDELLENLITTQSDHIGLLSAVEPLFEPLDIESHQV